MGRKSSILNLPPDIRIELGRRFIEHPALTIDQHLAWLQSQGCTIARSSLHRYLQANSRDLMKLHRHIRASKHKGTREVEASTENETDEVAVRLGCLMVAAGYSIPGDRVDLIRTADELTEWVNATSK